MFDHFNVLIFQGRCYCLGIAMGHWRSLASVEVYLVRIYLLLLHLSTFCRGIIDCFQLGWSGRCTLSAPAWMIKGTKRQSHAPLPRFFIYQWTTQQGRCPEKFQLCEHHLRISWFRDHFEFLCATFLCKCSRLPNTSLHNPILHLLNNFLDSDPQLTI